MPTYDYRCDACGEVLEVVHGVHEAGPSACPLCGGSLRKTFAPPTIVFKGTGWAKKDSRSNTRPAKSPAGSDKDASGGSSAADSSSTAD